MHIPYYGEEPESDSAPKPKKSSKIIAFIAATALAIVGHPALAEKYDFQPVSVKYPDVNVITVKSSMAFVDSLEEVIVTAKDMSELVKPSVQVFSLRLGHTNKQLIHVYDEQSNSWRFVGTSLSSITK